MSPVLYVLSSESRVVRTIERVLCYMYYRVSPVVYVLSSKSRGVRTIE